MEAIVTSNNFDASNSGKAQSAMFVDTSSRSMWSKLSGAPLRLLPFSSLIVFVFLAILQPNALHLLPNPAGPFQYNVNVTSQEIWSDTGLDMKQGDQITFTATPVASQSPSAQMAAPVGDNAAPRQGALAALPASDAPLGALLARIGDANRGTPIVVGARKQLTVSDTGRLFLGVNEQQPSQVSASFAVQIEVQPSGAAAASQSDSTSAGLVPAQALTKASQRELSDSNGDPAESVNLKLASAQEKKPFVAASLLSARNVPYPLNTTAEGIVVFSVSINSGGSVTNIKALNDIPPLTQAAKSSLQAWKFAAATSGGIPESSEMLVSFVFRHAIEISNPPDFAPVNSPPGRMGYTPPGISLAVYAEYPTSTVSAGAIVVQAVVRADGTLGEVKVVRSQSGGFDPLALKAAKNWQMEPAMLNGAPVASKLAIAFVFSSRAQNPF
jgi:TonB family protein